MKTRTYQLEYCENPHAPWQVFPVTYTSPETARSAVPALRALLSHGGHTDARIRLLRTTTATEREELPLLLDPVPEN